MFCFQNEEEKNKEGAVGRAEGRKGQISDYDVLFPVTLPVIIMIIIQEKYKFRD